MDTLAEQRMAQVTRDLQLLAFRFIQLRHTNDQLLAGLHELNARANLIDQASKAHGDVDASPLLRNDPSV